MHKAGLQAAAHNSNSSLRWLAADLIPNPPESKSSPGGTPIGCSSPGSPGTTRTKGQQCGVQLNWEVVLWRVGPGLSQGTETPFGWWMQSNSFHCFSVNVARKSTKWTTNFRGVGFAASSSKQAELTAFSSLLVPLDSSVHTTAASRVNVKNPLSTSRSQYDRCQGRH